MTNEDSLLAPEKFLQVPPTLACAIGLNQAIVLQHLYWLQKLPRGGKDIAGHHYVWNTYEQWKKEFFPFWSEHTIKRIFVDLEDKGMVASCQPDGSLSRKKYYRVTDSAIVSLTFQRFNDQAKLARSSGQNGPFLNSNILTETSIQKRKYKRKGDKKPKEEGESDSF